MDTHLLVYSFLLFYFASISAAYYLGRYSATVSHSFVDHTAKATARIRALPAAIARSEVRRDKSAADTIKVISPTKQRAASLKGLE